MGISIHALFAEGDFKRLAELTGKSISIHALFAEGDRMQGTDEEIAQAFLSTPSSQRATAAASAFATSSALISIHALFAEGDVTVW